MSPFSKEAYFGNSLIVSPMGDVLGRTTGQKNSFTINEISNENLARKAFSLQKRGSKPTVRLYEKRNEIYNFSYLKQLNIDE